MTEALPTVPAPTTMPQFATGWQRLGAGTIDFILCMIIQSLLNIIINDFRTVGVIYITLVTIYYIATESSSAQATWGKKLLSIYVASRTNLRPSIGTIAWRYTICILPSLPMLYFCLAIDLSFIVDDVGRFKMSEASQNSYIHPPAVIDAVVAISLSSLLAIVIGIVAYLIPMFLTKERTGLHDWLSGTRVYQGKPQPAPSAPSAPDAAA